MQQLILKELDILGLSNLNGRPFDCAHDILLKGDNERKLVIVGLNGSNADLEWTNEKAIIDGFTHPQVSNVHQGADGLWLSKTLPNRLLNLPTELGFSIENTIYTNAILLCSKNAAAIKSEAKKFGLTTNELVQKSLSFFENITIANSDVELIVAYSNSMNDISAASVIYEQFGHKCTPYISDDRNYHKTFSFLANIANKRIPVVCVRHMSRFKPNIKSIKNAVDRLSKNL